MKRKRQPLTPVTNGSAGRDRKKAAPASATTSGKRHSAATPPATMIPPPCLETEGCRIVGRIPCSGVVLGRYYSRRRSALEIDNYGSLRVDVVTEQNEGAKVIIQKEEVAHLSVTSCVVAFRLAFVSGLPSRYVDPRVEERSMIVVDLRSFDSNEQATPSYDDEDRKLFSRAIACHYTPLPKAVVGVLECKVRLLVAQAEQKRLKLAVARQKGEELASLTDAELAGQIAGIVAALRSLQNELDTRTADKLSRHQCICCADSLAEVLILPCRHLVLCEGCLRKLLLKATAHGVSCPLCRSEIMDHLTVYLS
ncbi:hypothetical protein DIPPA_30350 [Diplonema papillatum]|nr:hypothetical protein DIPPA_30350 [Diplonema papillatum]|eukprot:gene5856-8967_t